MKTTLDLPEELVATLETTANREHRDISDVAREAIRLGLGQLHDATTTPSLSDSSQAAEEWLHEWQELGARIRTKAVDPRPLVEILKEDRESRERTSRDPRTLLGEIRNLRSRVSVKQVSLDWIDGGPSAGASLILVDTAISPEAFVTA